MTDEPQINQQPCPECGGRKVIWRDVNGCYWKSDWMPCPTCKEHAAEQRLANHLDVIGDLKAGEES